MKLSPDDSSAGGAAPAPVNVSLVADDAVAIANTLGALVSAINPAAAGAVALITGAANLLRNTILPAVQHLESHQLSVIEQQTLATESAAERAKVGAAAANDN